MTAGAGLTLSNGNGEKRTAAGGEKTVEELMAAGIRPRQDAFLSELKKAANTKSWNRALTLLDGMREAGYQPLPGAYACAIRYVR